jgi:hypothetical protein
VIEQGFVQLIQNGINGGGNPLSPACPGGYAVQLPKDLIGTASGQVPYAWVYNSVLSTASYHLGGQDALTAWEVQIDCHGYTMPNAEALAYAIDSVLRGGYAGTLGDPNNTVVQGIFRQSKCLDGYSDLNRTFVRTLEYLINFQQV